MDKKCDQTCKFGFLGVFLLGLLGMWMVGKYYLKKEAVEERTERERRISSEVQRFKLHPDRRPASD